MTHHARLRFDHSQRNRQIAAALLVGFAAPFTAAAHAQTLQGHIQGEAQAEHRLHGQAGQMLSVVNGPGKAEFNVLRAGAEEAMFTSTISGANAQVRLPDDGEYVVRVFLMRALARRNEHTHYELRLTLSGQTLPALSPAQDALVAGTPYHATATLACQAGGPPTQCQAEVTRRGHDGTATLRLRSPTGQDRRVLFVSGQAVASDTMLLLQTHREADKLWLQLGGDERYELNDALLTGG